MQIQQISSFSVVSRCSGFCFTLH